MDVRIHSDNVSLSVAVAYHKRVDEQGDGEKEAHLHEQQLRSTLLHTQPHNLSHMNGSFTSTHTMWHTRNMRDLRRCHERAECDDHDDPACRHSCTGAREALGIVEKRA